MRAKARAESTAEEYRGADPSGLSPGLIQICSLADAGGVGGRGFSAGIPQCSGWPIRP